MEQGRQIAGAHVHLPGHQRHGQLLPDVGGNEDLGLADDLILGMYGVGSLEFSAGGGLALPQKGQQQLGQLGQDHIVGEFIHPFLLPEHLLQQVHRLLGGGEFAVDEGGDVKAGNIKGQGDIPGRYADVGVLHVPLAGAVDDDVALLEQQVLAVGHGVDAALVHIGQFRHLVGLTREDKALLLLLIEEGIEAVDLHAVFHAQVSAVPLAHDLRLALGRHLCGGGAINGHERKVYAGLDTDSLIQVEVLIILAVMGDAEDRHACAADQPHILSAAVYRGMVSIKLKGLALFAGTCLQAAAAFGQNRAEPLETDLIQIADHGTSSRKIKRWSNHTIAPSLYNK